MPCSLFPEPTPTGWCAWQRIPPSRTWTLVVEAATEAECRQQFRERPFTGKLRDVCFTRGKDPNRRRFRL
jgi:hypothetical protein